MISASSCQDWHNLWSHFCTRVKNTLTVWLRCFDVLWSHNNRNYPFWGTPILETPHIIDTSSQNPWLGFSSQLNPFSCFGGRLWVWPSALWVSWPLCYRWTWRPSRCPRRPGWLVGWLVGWMQWGWEKCGFYVLVLGREWCVDGLWMAVIFFCVCFVLGGMKDVENFELFCLKFIQRGTVFFVEDLYCTYFLSQANGRSVLYFRRKGVNVGRPFFTWYLQLKVTWYLCGICDDAEISYTNTYLVFIYIVFIHVCYFCEFPCLVHFHRFSAHLFNIPRPTPESQPKKNTLTSGEKGAWCWSCTRDPAEWRCHKKSTHNMFSFFCHSKGTGRIHQESTLEWCWVVFFFCFFFGGAGLCFLFHMSTIL